MRTIMGAGLLLVLSAAAQADDHDVLQVGVVHIQTLDHGEALHTDMQVAGEFSHFESPGTGTAVGNADTPVVAWTHFAGEHWAIKFEGGIPPKFDLYGRGTVAPPVALGLLNVDLGAANVNPIASVKQWSPAIFLQYWLGEAADTLRPYVGIGVTYTWYTDVRLNDNFRSELDQRFAMPLALLNGQSPEGTRISAEASASLAPILNAGLSYRLTPHWGLSATLSWIGLATDATIRLRSADGTLLAASSTHIDIQPLVTALLLSYQI